MYRHHAIIVLATFHHCVGYIPSLVFLRCHIIVVVQSPCNCRSSVKSSSLRCLHSSVVIILLPCLFTSSSHHHCQPLSSQCRSYAVTVNFTLFSLSTIIIVSLMSCWRSASIIPALHQHHSTVIRRIRMLKCRTFAFSEEVCVEDVSDMVVCCTQTTCRQPQT